MITVAGSGTTLGAE
jgi:hypothetical protein